MLKMIFCLMLAVVANALPTDDATALPGGVEIATERGISPNEHQPLFASLPEQCVSTTPWYNAGFNQVYQTHFGSQQEGSVVFPADERALLNTLVAAVEAQKRPTIVAGSHGYEGYGNSGDVVIDISGLQHIETKMAGPDNTKMAEHVVIGGGTPLSKVYNYLWKRHGRILPAGSCHSVSAGGHITGGGYGVFSRMYGLTVDYVGGVRFAWVDNETKVRVVDAFHNSNSPEEQRLVWAARGASAANFGVILEYYVPLDSLQPSLSSPNALPPPGEVAFVNNPPAFWEVAFNLMTPEEFKDAEYGPMMLEKLYDVFWDYYNYNKGEQPKRDETFGFFRINSNGIDLTCIATKYDALLEYVRGFLKAKNSTTADASLSTLEKDVRRFTFLEYVVVMSGIGDKPFFKNSGHVLKSHSGHGKGYTSSQLRAIYDHLLQKYKPCVGAACGEGYVTLEVFDSDKGSKMVTIQKVNQTDKSGKPQYFWISQHEARPASAQRRNGRRLAVWMGPQVDETALEGDADGPHPADNGVAYVWQMDPYNGKIADLTVENPLKTPHAPSATSVSNRVATVKTQPQLYWNFPEDNKFMIKWFDSFTNSMWASTSTNKLIEEQYPMVPGLYINYPDSFYKDMYPEDWLNLTYGNGNNVQGDQKDYLPSLQEVKGMFDPNDIFTLKSRRYIYNATNGAWDDEKPEIKDGLSIPLPDTMPEPYLGGEIHEPDNGIEKLVVC